MSKSLISTCYLVLSLVLFLLPGVSSAVPEGINLTWPGGPGPVTFDGTVHAKRGLHCDACHIAGLFQTKKGADREVERFFYSNGCGVMPAGGLSRKKSGSSSREVSSMSELRRERWIFSNPSVSISIRPGRVRGPVFVKL